MKRKSNDDDAGAMDSLLDTMTNVVGILVIVLVVTQLGVGDAVQRISESIKVDPKELALKKDELENLAEKQVLLETQVALLSPDKTVDEDLLDSEIEKLMKQLEKDTLDLENLKKRNSAAEMALAAHEESEKEKKLRTELENQIKVSLDEAAKLRATLDQTPEREILPPKEMRIPNPRPAPEGVRPFTLICSENRIYPLTGVSDYQKEARNRATAILAAKKFLTDPVKGIDAEKFLKEFNRKPMRNDFFDMQLAARNDGVPILVCTPKPRGGASLSEVDRKASRFNKDLAQLDPTKFYLQFLVCSDSYDIYMSAREQAESLKLAVGWSPQPPEWRYSFGIGGDLRLGPPRKPNPNPPKKPPTGPKKPANVID